MTKYDRLKQVMITEKGSDLLRWLENFAYWFDSGGWFEESEVREYLSEDYKYHEDDTVSELVQRGEKNE